MSKTTTIPLDWQPPSAKLTGEALRSYRLPPVALKMRAQHGVFLWWPESTDLWAHPDDIDVVRTFIPGTRIFRRETCQDYSDRQLGFVTYHYGEIRFRAKPILWLEVQPEGYQAGDRVEIKSDGGKLRAQLATIEEVMWDRHARRIEYLVTTRGTRLQKTFRVENFRPAIRLGDFMPVRHLDLVRQEQAVR